MDSQIIRKSITPLTAVYFFSGFTLYFFFLIFTLLPFLKSHFLINPALYWFITGYVLFTPLLIYALFRAKAEGNKGIRQCLNSLSIKPLSKKDWAYSLIGLLFTFILTGLIFGAFAFMHKYYGIKQLNTTPWFMEIRPFKGTEKLLLFVWLPMFLLNILGEEVLWRGYIQNRLSGKYAWFLCSLLWLVFHLPFGFDLIIMLVPVIFIIPYVYDKTKNAFVGIIIHGIYNGPIFVVIALGLIK